MYVWLRYYALVKNQNKSEIFWQINLLYSVRVFIHIEWGSSQVAQWLRIHLPMQESSLVGYSPWGHRVRHDWARIYIEYICCAMLSCSVMSDCATPRTAAHQAPLSLGILQASILEWVAMPSSRGSSWPRDRTQVSHIAGGFFTIWATGKSIGGGNIYIHTHTHTHT